MADQKISELVAAAGSSAADLIPIVQGGTNKKLTVANFLANLNSPVIINSTGSDQDTRIAGLQDDNLLVVDAGNDRVGFGTDTPLEKVDINGNLSVDGFIRTSGTPQTIQGFGSQIINNATSVTLVVTEGVTQLIMGDGVEGQIKTIMIKEFSANAELLPTHPSANYQKIVFNAVGQTATLQFIDGEWYIISLVGATFTL
jgi:hypothetical protein